MILNINNIRFTYNSHPVLDNVSFTLPAGRLLAILGPNGVGKTTLLKCINAILKPCSGNVLLGDRNVLSLSPSAIARDMGYVAQRSEPAQLTVYDAVLMGRKPHIRWRVGEKDLQMVDAVLKRLELKSLALRHIDRLSGGELQKVAVARALVQEPKLLLLDEPTSSLDLKNQVAILHLVRRVVDEHRIAAVMTMHDLNTALRFAHAFLFLKNGAIYAHGRTSQVTADMVEEVYGLPVDIHHVNGRPLVVPREEDGLPKEKPCPAHSHPTP